MKRILIILTGLAVLAPTPAAWADGMFLAPESLFIYEPVQQALVEWDSQSRTESLTILPAFYGDAESFAWIVPVPGLPTLELADRELFYNLDSVSQPVYRSRDGRWDCMGQQEYLVLAGGDNGGVNIISDELVGYFQTMIMSASDAPALLDSLTVWGFLHPGNIEAATAAITDYVDRSWYFVTMQVDSTALEEIYNYDYYPYYGGLEPITLTFASEQPVYPMKISAYSADDETRVNLYVKADHRMTFPGADTYYANRFSARELEELPYLVHLQDLLEPGDYLTKLRRRYTPLQMTEDIVLEQAADDEEFRLISYSGWPWTTALLLGPPLVWGVWRSRRRRRG